MRWLGIGEKPAAPIVPPEVEARFHDADRRNREAVIQARLSNRRLRQISSGADEAIADLMRMLEKKEAEDYDG